MEERSQIESKSTANCVRCRNTSIPGNYSSPRRCAFDASGIFTPENWNCVTLNDLRAHAGEVGDRGAEAFYVHRDDQSYAALWIPPHPDDVPDGEREGPFRGGGFIAMTWYKHHGRTDIAIRVDPHDGGLPLTADEAEAALENLRLHGKMVVAA